VLPRITSPSGATDAARRNQPKSHAKTRRSRRSQGVVARRDAEIAEGESWFALCPANAIGVVTPQLRVGRGTRTTLGSIPTREPTASRLWPIFASRLRSIHRCPLEICGPHHLTPFHKFLFHRRCRYAGRRFGAGFRLHEDRHGPLLPLGCGGRIMRASLGTLTGTWTLPHPVLLALSFWTFH
jgi:hypothetical protein